MSSVSMSAIVSRIDRLHCSPCSKMAMTFFHTNLMQCQHLYLFTSSHIIMALPMNSFCTFDFTSSYVFPNSKLSCSIFLTDLRNAPRYGSLIV